MPPTSRQPTRRSEVSPGTISHHGGLDTATDDALDQLAALAAQICAASAAVITLPDAEHRWPRTSAPLPTDNAFARALASDALQLVVPDTTLDPQFANDALVTATPSIRCYVGTPLLGAQGESVGSLTVTDHRPRQLESWQLDGLKTLSRQVVATLALRRQSHELAGNERMLRAVIESEPECVKLLGRDGSLRLMNRAGLMMIEADDFDQVAGACLYPLLHPQYRVEFEALTARVFEGGSGSMEFQVTGLKGGDRWLETHATPLRNEAGDIISLLGITRDITEAKETLAALSESESRLRLALGAARMGTFDWNLDTNIVHRTGLGTGPWSDTDDEPEATSFEALMSNVDPADAPQLRAAVADTIARGTHLDHEFRVVWPDGTVHWIAIHGEFARDETEAPRLLRGVVTEVTERKAAEQQISRLNRVHAMLSEINECIVREHDSTALLEKACQIAVVHGHFLLAWAGLHVGESDHLGIVAHAGASRETEAVLRALVETATPEESCQITAQALLTAAPSVCNDIAGDPAAATWRGVALERGYRSMASLPLIRDGRVAGAFNLYAAEPGFFDSAELRLLGQLSRDIAFALDAHEQEAARREAEAALRESEERLRQLAENIREAFWMTDPRRGAILYVSRAYETIWGRTAASLYSSPHTWLESVHPDDRIRVAAAADQQKIGGPYDETYRILRPDGTIRWVHDRAYPVHDAEGETVRIVGTAEDITERRRLEEQYFQSQKLQAVGQLAGGVAHDFNNLLTVIQGYASLLTVPGESAESIQESALQIVGASERAATLTRQLLAFSRRQVLQSRRVDLNSIITSLAKMLQRVVGEDIEIQLKLHPHPLMTQADAGMLDQVLLNLIINARDAMPSGGEIEIETFDRLLSDDDVCHLPGATAGHHVGLRVTDTGEGIPADVIAQIFEPFFTTKPLGKGTGLGLATVFGIVSQHKGAISVQSDVDRGTTFVVYLPLVAEAIDESPHGERSGGGSETILLVEDDSAVRRLSRKILERAGFVVLEAADGPDALQLFDRLGHSVDLLLTDLVMPGGISGIELATELRIRNPKLPVILTSGYSAETAGREVTLGNYQRFLEKPASPAELLAAVRASLEAHPRQKGPA